MRKEQNNSNENHPYCESVIIKCGDYAENRCQEQKYVERLGPYPIEQWNKRCNNYNGRTQIGLLGYDPGRYHYRNNRHK